MNTLAHSSAHSSPAPAETPRDPRSPNQIYFADFAGRRVAALARRRLPLLGLATLIFVAGCSRQESRVQPSPEPAVRVSAASVRLESFPEFTALSGTVRPVERASIAAKLTGTVEHLDVTLGQPVQAGQLLGRIAAPELSARLQQAQSQSSQAERDLARERALLAQNATPADLVKSLEDRVNLTRAMVAEAEVMLGYTSLRAPFAGVIAAKLVDSGDFALSGVPLIVIEGSTAFEVEVAVPADLMRYAPIGSHLTISMPATGSDLAGRLVEISPAIDPATRTGLAKLALTGVPGPRSGEFVRVLWPSGELPALTAPATAVTTVGQMERVFVVLAGRAQLRIVKTGFHRGDRVQIQAGLDAGEIIVLDPPAVLRDGSPLEVAP